MALVLNDRVLESSTTTGTGPFTLAGAASSFQSFSTGIGANNTTYYAIANTGANEWEVGLGTLDATGLILTRTTVYRSSNSNSVVTFSAGTKNVFCTYPASKSINYDASGNVAISNATLTAATVASNLLFSGTALRFQGDFSNATFNSRLAFQSSTTNATTGIYAIPNGTSTAASWQAVNNSDANNASKVGISASATDVQLFSGINGTGSYLPLAFYNNGAEKARLAVSGGFSVGTTTDPGAGVILANNGVKVGTSINTQTIPFTPTNIMVNFGTTPVQSFNQTFIDAAATTANRVMITPTATATNTLLAVGTITGGTSYGTGTFYNVPLTGGSGTGATASQITTAGSVQTVTMPVAAAAVVNGSITTAGSGYFPASGSATYLNVPLTGGAGIGAVATSVTVTNGAITAVVLPATGAGAGYATTNTLSASNTYLGGAGSGFVYTVSAVSVFGTGYAYGDTLSASNANLGGAGSGFSVPVALVSAGTDELEMDGIKASAYCGTNGLVTVYFDASPGYIAGGRNFAYTLG